MNPHILRYNVTLHSDSIPFNLYNEGFLKSAVMFEIVEMYIFQIHLHYFF